MDSSDERLADLEAQNSRLLAQLDLKGSPFCVGRCEGIRAAHVISTVVDPCYAECEFRKYKEMVDEYEELLKEGGPKEAKILELAKKVWCFA